MNHTQRLKRRHAPSVDCRPQAQIHTYFKAHWHSPNHNARPQGMLIDTVVIHNITLPPGELSPRYVRALFTNQLPADAHPYFKAVAGVRVSAHFYIARSGRVVQCVPLHRRAWHAGKSSMPSHLAHIPTRDNVNNFSIGIELAGTDTLPYTRAQYEALARVLRRLGQAYPIASVLGHCDIAPGRKTDPGVSFDWARAARAVPAAWGWQWR